VRRRGDHHRLPSTNAEGHRLHPGRLRLEIVFAEDDTQLKKLTEQRSQLPNLAKVVLFDGTSDDDWVITLDDLADQGAKYLAEHPSCVRNVADEIKPSSWRPLIYTSGTTASPRACARTQPGCTPRRDRRHGSANDDDLQLLWLPLAHASARC